MKHEPEQYRLICEGCGFRTWGPDRVAETGRKCPDCNAPIALLGGAYGVTNEKRRLRPDLVDELMDDGYRRPEELHERSGSGWEHACRGEVFVLTVEVIQETEDPPVELLHSELPETPKSSKQEIEVIETKLRELADEVDADPALFLEVYERVTEETAEG